MPGALDKARPTLAALPPLGRARQVARALSDYIEAAGLGPGDRLPPERDLTQSLRVGRSSLREAVSQLQALGVLEARIGSGTFVLKSVSGRTVHLPLSIEAHGPGRHAATYARSPSRDRDRGVDGGGPTTHDGGSRTNRFSARRRWRPRIVARGPRARKTWPFTSRYTMPAATHCSGKCWSSCAKCSSSSGASRSAAPTSRHARCPFHRQLYEAIRDGDPAAAAAHTRAILDIVEEDIRDMSR